MKRILILIGVLFLLSGCSLFQEPIVPAVQADEGLGCSVAPNPKTLFKDVAINEPISIPAKCHGEIVEIETDALTNELKVDCKKNVESATASLRGELENLQDMLRNNENLLPEVKFLDRVSKSGSGGVIAKYDKPVFLVGPRKNYWLKCTGSMRPTFDCNDYLIAYKPTSRWDVKVGDVIGFQSPDHDMIVIHRIVYKLGDQYVTRGDNAMQFKHDMNIDGKHFVGVDPYKPSFDDIEYKILGVVWQ